MRQGILIMFCIALLPFYATAQGGFKMVETGKSNMLTPRKVTTPANEYNFMQDDFARNKIAVNIDASKQNKSAVEVKSDFEENDASSKTENTKGIKKKTPSPSPLIAPFSPNLCCGFDPMIAAGEKYLIVSMDHEFAFYDKNGSQLKDKNGKVISSTSYTDFFKPLLDDANSTTFSNLKNAPHSVLADCGASAGDAKTETNKELCEAYDSRVIYEPINKRFIMVSAVRNLVWQGGSLPSLCNGYETRIFAFAISNTDDPRDGFKMWYWTKNNVRDWPNVSADKDVLTITHNGGGQGGDATPAIYVISMKDMMNGVGSPRYFTYFSGSDNTPAAVIPVAMFKSTPAFKSTTTFFDDYIMYFTSDGSNADLYYFKKSGDMWTKKPQLNKTSIDVGIAIDYSWEERPVYRNGNFYFNSRGINMMDIPIMPMQGTWGFILYRLPLKQDGANIAFDGSNTKNLHYHVFPHWASMTDYASYEVPAVTVDHNGTMLEAYGRYGKISKTEDIFPESRYFVFFQDEAGHRLSHALKTGNYMPMVKPSAEWVSSVPDGFYHSYNPADIFVDYTTATADPIKENVFWIAHTYADSVSAKNKGYKMVVGEVEAKE